MARKKVIMKKHLKTMIEILNEGPLKSAQFFNKAMNKGIPKSTYFSIRNEESAESIPFEKRQIIKLTYNGIDYYYNSTNVYHHLEKIAFADGKNSDESQYKLQIWTKHSERIKQTLQSLRNQIPSANLQYNPTLKLITFDDLNLGVPIEHLFLHDELGKDFKDIFITVNESYSHFENLKRSLFKDLSRVISNRVSTIDQRIIPEPEFLKAFYYALLEPDTIFKFDFLRRLPLVYYNNYYCPSVGDNLWNGWLLFRGKSSEEMDLRINEMKNDLIDEVAENENFKKNIKELYKNRRTLEKTINKFKSRLDYLLIRECFFPCEDLHFKMEHSKARKHVE